MSLENVKAFFQQYDMEDRVIEFDVSSATVDLAAAALGCESERIAKTLAFRIDEKALLVVVAGDAKIANKKYKAYFKAKAKMLTAEELETMVGHPVGGVCPFGIKEAVDVYFDESLKRFDTVFPACGSPNSAIELSIRELEEYAQPIEWIDVCQGWQPD